MKVSSGILNVFNKSLSWKGEKNQTLISQLIQGLIFWFSNEENRHYLKNGVHHNRKWTIPRELWDFKNIKAPFIHMLQLLYKKKKKENH